MQICKYARMQVCNYTTMQVYNLILSNQSNQSNQSSTHSDTTVQTWSVVWISVNFYFIQHFFNSNLTEVQHQLKKKKENNNYNQVGFAFCLK